MDLIADDAHAVTDADLAHPAQLLLGPHAAHRVVGATEDQHFILGVCGQLFQQVKVHRIGIVFINQRAADHLAATVFRSHIEGVIDRGHEDDAVAGLAEGFDHNEQGGDYAAGTDDRFGVHIPAVLPLHPGAHGFPVFLGGAGVAQYMGVHILLQAFGNFRGVFQFHIGHREGHHAFFGGRVLFPHGFPFSRTVGTAVDQGFEIVFHSNNTSKNLRRKAACFRQYPLSSFCPYLSTGANAGALAWGCGLVHLLL